MDTLQTLTTEIIKLADDNVRQAVGQILVQVGNDLSELGKKYMNGAPRRRGRKPKAETADVAVEQPKKRRGRKPKAEVTDEQPKKRRGRKPKAEQPEAVQEVKTAARKKTRQSKSVYEMMEKEDA